MPSHCGDRLFDHLVGCHLHDQRHCEAKRLRRFEIDDQLEFSGLDDRQVRWFGALKNSTGIDPGLTICVRKVGSVAHQTAHLYLLSNWKDYGYCVTRYQCHESSGCAQETINAMSRAAVLKKNVSA